MISTINFSSFFKRRYKQLTDQQKADFKYAIQLFTENPFHPKLKTHKLKGKWKGFCSFSINYSDRVLFKLSDKDTVDLINIGDHSIYR
ncbi:MAG: type II toxin-antitoxin system mRNA interferase toxin, RelE/StbE family [Nitrospinae bacterium]|nr:type II toxin-antitoxin system mRNA interferase toxin, RelE/StbE family [Nitrospinota bacterium]